MSVVKFVEIREAEKEIQKISEATIERLNKEHNIVFAPTKAVATVAYCFLAEAINHLSQNKEAGKNVSLNLFQLVELGIEFEECDDTEKPNNFIPVAIPGQEFKLLVKADEE